MISIRPTSFVFGLLMLNLLALRESVAFATEKQVINGGQVSNLESGKDILDGTSTTAIEVGGRKMMKMKKKEVSIHGETGSKIVGPKHTIENRNQKRTRKHKVEEKLRKRTTSRQHQSEAKMRSFMALNADYHAPKSHPPKNN